MATLKLRTDRSGTCRYECPDCGAVSTFEPARAGGGSVEVEINCECGHLERALVNTRRSLRKVVRVKGICSASNGATYPIEVTSLSQSGLGFELDDRASLEVGDEIVVKLRIKDDVDVMIPKNAVVRQVRGRFIGAEFLSREVKSPIDKISDSALSYFTFKAEPEPED